MTFNFNDISCTSMGVKIITMSGPQRAPCGIEIVTIPGRYEPLTRGKPEHETTEITASLLIDDNADIHKIFAWLKGRGRLIFSDEPEKYYNVISNDVISTQYVCDRIKSFEVKFVCEPFAYSVTDKFTNVPMMMSDKSLTGSLEIEYNGTCEGEPLLYFAVAGKLRVTVNDSEEPLIITTHGRITDTVLKTENEIISDGTYTDENGTIIESSGTETVTTYAYEYNLEYIYIDSAARIAYNAAGEVVNNKTSGKFPVFRKGTNKILFELIKEEWYLYKTTKLQSYNQKLEMFGYHKNERWY